MAVNSPDRYQAITFTVALSYALLHSVDVSEPPGLIFYFTQIGASRSGPLTQSRIRDSAGS
jgi:hypothetical protein